MMKCSNMLWATSQSAVLFLVIACGGSLGTDKQEHVHNMARCHAF